MKGLILSEKFFEEYGLPLIKGTFEEFSDRIAAGLVGHGSECFGFDDDISRDHDFEAGFCFYLTDEDEKTFGFKLFRAYSKLPDEYLGVKKAKASLFGDGNKGVKTIKEFYSFYLPGGELPATNEDWLRIPDFYLAEATNGKVFYDGLGEFTRIREGIKNGIPSDVWLKKLASALFYAAQYGQYNYERCLLHGEKLSASYALGRFAEYSAKAFFLLKQKHAPYYKWLFRSLRELGNTENTVADKLEVALSAPFDKNRNINIIEEICCLLRKEIAASPLTGGNNICGSGDYLEPYAYQINNLIKDGNLRNMPVML